MTHSTPFEIFCACPPGLETYLADEMVEAGFRGVSATGGGATFEGTWVDVWRANLMLRGASKVLARIGTFRAFHLAQLDKRARKFPWGDILTEGHRVKVEVVTNRKSKIYHAGAATERLERAIAEEFGAPIAEGLEDAQIVIKARIDDNNVILSVDTSGDGLHKRGFKQAMGKAPMRETMAALILRACGYAGANLCWTRCAALAPFRLKRRRLRGVSWQGAVAALLSSGWRPSTPRRWRMCVRLGPSATPTSISTARIAT